MSKTGIVLDWDGTLHEHAHYRPGKFGNVDLSLIDEAFDRGLSVAISTCNDVWRISEYLRDAGYRTKTDIGRTLGQCGWDGGESGRVILVTNLKVSGYLIDDRAFNYRYGFPTDGVWEQVEASEWMKDHGWTARGPGHVSRVNAEQRKISQDPYGKAPNSIERSWAGQ